MFLAFKDGPNEKYSKNLQNSHFWKQGKMQLDGQFARCRQLWNDLYTVKPAHKVTSIKQSPVLKGQDFLVIS